MMQTEINVVVKMLWVITQLISLVQFNNDLELSIINKNNVLKIIHLETDSIAPLKNVLTLLVKNWFFPLF